MYVVSSLVGSRFTAGATKSSSTNTIRKPDSTSKNNNNQHHHARVPSGKGGGEMPLAATVKSQMLRLLRRSKSTRGPPSGSSARSSSSRKNGGGDTAMVIPNKRYSVLVDSPPSPNNGIVPIVEPYTMALGSPVAVTTPSKPSDGTRKQIPNNSQRIRENNHRSASQARRHRSQNKWNVCMTYGHDKLSTLVTELVSWTVYVT
ncbi:hypothetical protein C0J52_11900 [Blattella germanica]|nr:hypothetical protein C0J52_11900 [Blattella germanica]